MLGSRLSALLMGEVLWVLSEAWVRKKAHFESTLLRNW